MRTRLLATVIGALSFMGGVAAMAQQATQPGTVQVPPLATEPLPTAGGGQAAMGAAVTGSTPAPGAASTIDKSQEQQGKLLKPGAAAGDMDAASGADAQPK